MGALRAVYIIWYRELLRLRRDRIRIVGALAFPLLFLAIFAGGLGRVVGMVTEGVNFTKFMFPGIVGMTVLMTSFMSGVSIVWEREVGFLKEVLVAPVPRSAIVVGKILGGATVSMFQGTLILALAPLLGVSLTLPLVLKLWPLMLVVACALGGMGILIASRMRSMEAFQVVMQTTIFPMIFLSGVFFPVGNLPVWMNVVVKINPVTYGVDSIRQMMLGVGGSGGESAPLGAALPSFGLTLMGHPMSIAEDLMVVAAFGLVMVALAMWSFGHQE
jgi:ABC-2 type transport system permease protein